jgi:hypothetical protein
LLWNWNYRRRWELSGNIVPYSLAEVDQHFRGVYCLNHCPDDGGSMHLRNVSQLQDYTVQYPTISSSYSQPWEPEISHGITDVCKRDIYVLFVVFILYCISKLNFLSAKHNYYLKQNRSKLIFKRYFWSYGLWFHAKTTTYISAVMTASILKFLKSLFLGMNTDTAQLLYWSVCPSACIK